MKKGTIVIGLILNLLIFGGVGFSVANAYFGFWGPGAGIEWELFYYFTIDSNVLLGVAALLMAIVDIAMLAGKKVCRFVQVLKLIGVVSTLITALVVLIYFYLIEKQPIDFLYDLKYNLYLHAVIPVLGLFSFILENEPRMKAWKYAFFGMIGPVLYGGVLVPLLNLDIIPKAKAPYDFLLIDMDKIWVSVAWLGGFLVGSYVLAFLVLLLHNIGSQKEVLEEAEPAPAEEPKEEPVAELPPVNQAEPLLEEGEEAAAPAEPEEKPEEPEEVPEEQPEEVPVQEEAPPEKEGKKPEEVTVLAPRTAYARPKLKKVTAARTYHITKQPNGEWQVKLAGGKKAIKLFPTQREAIAYARGLVESRGGSYRIHSVKGKIRS